MSRFSPNHLLTGRLRVGLLVLLLGLFAVVASRARADEAEVPGKFFVASIVGSGTCIIDGRVIEIKKGDTLDARAAIIRTGADAHMVVVFSNGTAVYLDQNTRLDIDKFEQEFFSPTNDLGREPSNSSMIARVVTGRIFIATPELRGGTSLIFETNQTAVTLQSGQFMISTDDDDTQVAVIAGHATVNTRDTRGNVAAIGPRLSAGQQTVIQSAQPGFPSPSSLPVTITPFVLSGPSGIAGIAAQLAAVQTARSSVFFSIAASFGTAGDRLFTVAAQPTVPPVLPLDFVVSPAVGR